MVQSDTFNYVHNSDLKAYLTIKIGSLEGKRSKPTYKELLKNPVLQYSGCNQECSDLIVESRIYADGKYITLPIFTSYKAFSKRWNWNEWLMFPIRYCDLPRNAILLITIYDYEAPRKRVIVGGTSISLFGRDGVLPRGLHDLRVWPGVPADSLKTPGKGPLMNGGNDQMYRLNKLVKNHESGHIPTVDWLDRLVFREIEVINDKEKRSSEFMYLMIEFPKVEIKGLLYHVIWWENKVEPENYSINKYYNDMPLYDPEVGLENISESKHHHLTRSLQSGVADKGIKPNTTNRDILKKITNYPPTKQLKNDEQDLVWKYRFYLKQDNRLLTKFLKCVNWNLEKEADQALCLLNEWARPDPTDALELLGPEFSHPEVRIYAVKLLRNPKVDKLLYLIQLVQALRYESWDVKAMNLLDTSHYSFGSESESSADAVNFYVEPLPIKIVVVEVPKPDKKVKKEPKQQNTSGTEEEDEETYSEEPDILIEGNPFGDSGQDLASFLIGMACKNYILANYLYWYLLVECEDKSPDQGVKPESKVREMYVWVLNALKMALQQYDDSSRQTFHFLLRQHQFMNKLVSIMQIVSKETSGRLKKVEKLQSLLADPEMNLSHFEPLPLPLNPEVKVCGIVAEKANLFKSALEPCKLTFKTIDDSEYITIFKCGDDLRQDQLIIQIISLMDKILQDEFLEMRLTPYKVLATSSKHGFVQYIDSLSVAEVLRTAGSIQSFFRLHAPVETAPYGISTTVMDNYVRSCAGYCIITYILGIGDRHFDNLLLTREGHLFHIDFGYILGRDPKPLPPPMKLTKEMVDAMGGQSSDYYSFFRRHCYTTYSQLRHKSSLVLHLFSLMVDASVPDIALEPDKTTKKVEDRFCLFLNEEEAIAHVQEVIDASVSAVVAVVVEHIHRFAQYIRK